MALAARVRLVRIPNLLGPYDGITLGVIVLLTKDVPADGWSRLIAHELVHVRQWSDQGVIRFAWTYLTQFVIGLARTRNWQQAYRQIEAEVEARGITDDWQRRRNTRPPDAPHPGPFP